MGYKLWAPGQVVTAADLNDYLMRQTIIQCTSTTRPADPQQGMVVYETDTSRFREYTGTDWVPRNERYTASGTPAAVSLTTGSLGVNALAGSVLATACPWTPYVPFSIHVSVGCYVSPVTDTDRTAITLKLGPTGALVDTRTARIQGSGSVTFTYDSQRTAGTIPDFQTVLSKFTGSSTTTSVADGEYNWLSVTIATRW